MDQTPPPTAPAARPLRILVVEDDPAIGMALSEMLQDMGHEVCAIETTEAGAILAARREAPDLMIVDPGLTRGSGVSAVETILTDRPVPYFFISGGRVKGTRPGAIVLEKPFFEQGLRRAIEKCLSPLPAP